jgi:hypothetical protein
MTQNDSDVEMTQVNETMDQTATQPKLEMSPNKIRKALREARDEMQGKF